jgi:hypothetical protein
MSQRIRLSCGKVRTRSSALPVCRARQQTTGPGAHAQHRHRVFIDSHGCACTSTIRGVPSEVILNEEDGIKSRCAVNLHNAVTMSQQRMGKRVAQLSPARMNEVCAVWHAFCGKGWELAPLTPARKTLRPLKSSRASLVLDMGYEGNHEHRHDGRRDKSGHDPARPVALGGRL